MRIPLNPGETAALEVGCPLCGQQKGKKCKSMKGNEVSNKLIPRPHKARVLQARDLTAMKAAKHQRLPLGLGVVGNAGLTSV
jgi:hypothetical protein